MGKGKEDIEILREVLVKEYGFKVFDYLRKLDGIDNEDLIESLSIYKNLEAIHKSGESTGKSGSFMFMSHCGKFIIKTMFESEFHIIMDDLEEYFEYILCHPKSLVSRFYGIFEV